MYAAHIPYEAKVERKAKVSLAGNIAKPAVSSGINNTCGRHLDLNLHNEDLPDMTFGDFPTLRNRPGPTR